jgi:hypothetical protein
MNLRITGQLISVIAMLACAVAVHGFAQSPESTEAAANRLLEIESITIKGSRLPSDSVIRLSGLKVHDKVNDLMVNAACHKITATGLVKTIDYAYDVYPDRPTAALILTPSDEGPLFPATIKPLALADALWACLQVRDPIFTKELPRTEKALTFYSKNLDACLEQNGHPNEYAAAAVAGDSSGNATGIVFEVRRYRNGPK